MGAYLSSASVTKTSSDAESAALRVGASAMQGWRSSMEDAHAAILELDQETAFFGVYDGHGGKEVAQYCSRHLHEELLRSEDFAEGRLPEALAAAYLKMDEMMKQEEGHLELRSIVHGISVGAEKPDQSEAEESKETYNGPTAGCTAVVAVVRNGQLAVANAGDSRCVISRNGKAVDMSTDHKPELPAERERITNAGGFIFDGRINGCLNLSRAIGDMEYKQNLLLDPKGQMVTAFPEISQACLQTGDEFMILACDGVWDVMSSQEVVDFVRERLQQQPDVALSSICEALFDTCVAPSKEGGGLGMDNMSAVLVVFKAASREGRLPLAGG